MLLSGLALMMIMMWPFIPMFLIELHFAVGFWRKLGIWTYVAIFIEWLPVALVIYLFNEAILYYEIALGVPFLILGIILIALAIVLHSWTAKLLGIKATIGYTEIKSDTIPDNQELITSGPFSVVRHPSYWAHTAILTGFFLITGVFAMGLVTIIDLTITYFVTTNLEDAELVGRFGQKYKNYQRRVPKFFPKINYRPSSKDTK